ncbi:MAG: hypothetical protein KIT83_16370 [Bryobacterales bacterium]|nr:hypothetical protein [Bryobacterales bacterium]
MGLDGVELVLAIEDKFQIFLEDDEISGVSTMGQLQALVLTKLGQTTPQACATSRAFYAVRSGLMQGLGVARNDVRPATALDSLFTSTPRLRRIQWARVQRATAHRVPHLERTALWAYGSLAIGAVMGPLVAYWLGAPWLIVGLSVIPGIVVGLGALSAVPCGARNFPHNSVTVGDLARVVLGGNVADFRHVSSRWTDQDVWHALKMIVVEQTGLSPEKVQPDALIVDDLGIE